MSAWETFGVHLPALLPFRTQLAWIIQIDPIRRFPRSVLMEPELSSHVSNHAPACVSLKPHAPQLDAFGLFPETRED
jgi:hypothetical protein